MTIYSICGVCFVCVSAVILLKENGAVAHARILSSFAVLIVSFFVITSVGQAIKSFFSLGEGSVNAPYLEVILKALGVAFVCEISSDAVRELGSESIGRWIELAGKAEIIMLSSPLLIELLRRSKALF